MNKYRIKKKIKNEITRIIRKVGEKKYFVNLKRVNKVISLDDP